ncbi:MAG: sel1 repeat family protein [Chlorobiaceae bacterium]|nr:sel1 repeat family protein [Chlorobiaceae bacterium]
MKKLVLIVLLSWCALGNKPVCADVHDPDIAELQSNAVTGDLKAQFSFAFYLCFNDPDGLAKALPWFMRAEEHGDPVCQYVTARILIRMDDEVASAIPWLKKSASKGFLPAMNLLGELYSNKYHGIEVNYAEAENWFRKASDGGYPQASFNLGKMYLDGKGLPVDRVKATELLKKSGNEGVKLLNSKGLLL